MHVELMTSTPAVLHLCSDYAKQAIYSELVARLDGLGTRQCVYVPVRSRSELDRNRKNGLSLTTFHYSHVLRPIHRILFRRKIKTVLEDIVLKVDPTSLTVVHAHFMYSDGAAALALHKRFGLPYVVAVRNTDVNAFMRFRPDLDRLGREVLSRAQRVVLITPAYREIVLGRVPRHSRASLAAKIQAIPNGLAQFWLDHVPSDRPHSSGELKLIYVGDFSRNKNVTTTMRAVALLNACQKASLTLVGSGGDGENEVEAMLASGRYPFVRRVGRVDNPGELLSLYRAHDIFVMPSFRETFGVAYLEALSQGLPVVFTRGQGIDGYFEPGTVGEAVDPRSDAGVAEGILALASRLDQVRHECLVCVRSFTWDDVARSYLAIYRELTGRGSKVEVR